MLVGFQDDPSLRWRDDRQGVFDVAEKANAGIVRTTVYWSRIAEKRPANAANPFDPAYHFDDLDEFVRNAGMHGMEVMLTIWGTPCLGERRQGPELRSDQRRRPPELRARARVAVLGPLQRATRSCASTRSGTSRTSGSSCRRSTTRKGKPVAPRIYAKLYRAAYAGIKAGNPRALVGIGETSARGRDKPLGRAGTQETESPGKFAELLSKQRPTLQFDAWSHHPYSTTPSSPPTQKVRWPNVNLSQLPRFEQSLELWFQQGRADLDHGVRLRDEAGRAARASAPGSRPPTCARR